jgi:anti-sigma factor RsiW
MEITRDVMLDLMPLYMAGEASADTRALVEEYLKTDPQLANIAEQRAAMDLPNNIPVPETEEGQVKSYRMAKRLWLLGSVVLAVVVAAGVGLAVMAFYVISQPVVLP